MTDTANLIFTGPGRKPFKTGSANKWSAVCRQLCLGQPGNRRKAASSSSAILYAHQIRGR